MAIPEAEIIGTPAGHAPSGPGWFLLNLAGARACAVAGHGVFTDFEASDAFFEHFGLNVHVVAPGERSALYHSEPAQEGFLVLAGECIAAVEEQERPMRAWDYLHCPPGTAHAFVGAGDAPCAILMVGARLSDAPATYPVSEVAARHGLSVPVATGVSREAYASANWGQDERGVPMSWPPSSSSTSAR